MIESPLLLDTCAVLWISDGTISQAGLQVLDAGSRAGVHAHVSPITAWEIGLLAARGRLKSPLAPQRLFQRIVEVPYVRLAAMPPEILIASCLLPGSPPRDPADRIILTTAREYGYRVMTRDSSILKYADDGYVDAVAC